MGLDNDLVINAVDLLERSLGEDQKMFPSGVSLGSLSNLAYGLSNSMSNAVMRTGDGRLIVQDNLTVNKVATISGIKLIRTP